MGLKKAYDELTGTTLSGATLSGRFTVVDENDDVQIRYDTDLHGTGAISLLDSKMYLPMSDDSGRQWFKYAFPDSPDNDIRGGGFSVEHSFITGDNTYQDLVDPSGGLYIIRAETENSPSTGSANRSFTDIVSSSRNQSITTMAKNNGKYNQNSRQYRESGRQLQIQTEPNDLTITVLKLE